MKKLRFVTITALVAAIGFSLALATIACDDGNNNNENNTGGNTGTTGTVPTIVSITAVYTPTTEIFPDTTLVTLKEGLTVTAHYSDSTTAPVTAYNLSIEGEEFTVGENTVTVNYTEGGITKTTTFKVTVNAAHAHSWSGWTPTTPATCTTEGVEKRTCSASPTHDEFRELAIVPTAHRYTWKQTTAPTCTEAGVETEICDYNDTHIGGTRTGAAAIGHDYQWTVTTPATATTDGTETEVCSHNNTHTQNPRTLWALGTAGLEFDLNGSGTGYIVSRGSASGAICIPAYHRETTNYADYKPVTEIEGYGFYSVPTNITALTFAAGNQLKTIGEDAFWDCTNLTSVTNIPASVTTIEEYAFRGCTNLATVTFAAESQLQTLSNSVFRECSSLTSITIPASVTAIEQMAFNQSGLTSVTFEGTIANASFFPGPGSNSFPGDLRDKFYATNSTNGTPGTYTRTSGSNTWTKQPSALDLIGTWKCTTGDYQPYTLTITANSVKWEDTDGEYIQYTNVVWATATSSIANYPTGYTFTGTRTSNGYDSNLGFIALSTDSNSVWLGVNASTSHIPNSSGPTYTKQ